MVDFYLQKLFDKESLIFIRKIKAKKYPPSKPPGGFVFMKLLMLLPL